MPHRTLVFVLWSFIAISTSAYGADTLESFAQKCDQAIGVTVPDFNSDDVLATEVPTTHFANNLCDRPNVLNGQCDPGSRFRVLINNADAYVVAHSRKQGNPSGQYGDIAVIQHNKVNGATCFYQGALNLSHNGNVKAPSKGVGNPAFWMTPSAIANSTFPCIRCHDNGPIIRSPYLTQIIGPNKLPGAGDNAFNRDQPYSFVGSDFASWKAYKVEVSGNLCNSCHRLGVNNVSSSGTARDLGIKATATSQASKNPHSANSPLWMLPGQTSYSQANADAAMAIKQCADQFHEGAPLPNTSSCKITQFTNLVPDFLLQTGTPLHETDDTFAFALASNNDLFAIKKSSTGTHMTEVHVLSAASNYQQFSLQTGTVLHETDAMFDFLLAPNRDLFAIKKSNTGSNSTEIHVLSAASNYQNFILQTGTVLHETDATFEFALAPNSDLVAIKKSNTGTHSTEVHVLSASSNYQQFILQTGTVLHETDVTFEFALASNRDLVAIKKSNTGTNSTEVHVLSAASNYQLFILQTGTALHETDQSFTFDITASRDLFAIKKRNTGTHTTEVHIVNVP